MQECTNNFPVLGVLGNQETFEGIRRGPGCREPRRKVRLGLPCRRGGNSLSSPAYYCDHDRKQQSCQGGWWVAPSIHRAAEKGCSRKPLCSPPNCYALRPGQKAVAHPK